MVKAFFDASILLGLLSDDHARADRAEAIVADGMSAEAVLDEALGFMHRALGIPWPEALEFAELVSGISRFVAADAATHASARSLLRDHSLGIDGALAVAAALSAGCDTFYSERLDDGLQIAGRLTVRNPFAGDAQMPAGDPRQDHAARRLAGLYARPGFLLRRAHQISASIFEGACADIELTPSQFAVLTVLDAQPGLDQATLARSIGLDKVTVSHLLRALEGRGLVVRASTQQNRRSVATELTPAGAELLNCAEPRLERAYQQFLAPLAPFEQRQLLALLHTLNSELEGIARTEFKPIQP